jgi:hypothetical protein
VVPKYPRSSNYIKVALIIIHTLGSTQGESQSAVVGDVSVSPSPILVLESCSNYDDLSKSQNKSYDVKKQSYRHIQNEVSRAMIGIEKVHTVILELVKDYVTMNIRSCLVKDILQSLTRRFKKTSEDIQRQTNRRYDDLRNSHPVKGKIEPWIQKWEALREEMISLKIDPIYREHIYT